MVVMDTHPNAEVLKIGKNQNGLFKLSVREQAGPNLTIPYTH